MESGRRGYFQRVHPGEKLGQSWGSTVSAFESLSWVSQTNQDAVFVGGVDVVSVWEDLLSERAVVSDEGWLQDARRSVQFMP